MVTNILGKDDSFLKDQFRRNAWIAPSYKHLEIPHEIQVVSPSGLKGKASHLLLEGKVNRTHVLTATAGFIMRWGTNLFDLIAIFVVVACLPIAIALAYLANHPFIG